MTPRWLEILKLEFSDPYLAIAATFAVFILLLHYGWIPPLESYPWLIPLAWFGLLLFGFCGSFRSRMPSRRDYQSARAPDAGSRHFA